MFTFDRVFDGDSNQDYVYKETQIDKLINKVVEASFHFLT